MAAYENLFSINGIEFTDQNRTISESREERSVAVQLANGNTMKYVMGEKKRWSINWTWLPDNEQLTYDGKGARDHIRALSYTGNTYTLVMRSSYGSIETYTIFIESYSENIVRRDTVNGQYFYDVSVELAEQ